VKKYLKLILRLMNLFMFCLNGSLMLSLIDMLLFFSVLWLVVFIVFGLLLVIMV